MQKYDGKLPLLYTANRWLARFHAPIVNAPIAAGTRDRENDDGLPDFMQSLIMSQGREMLNWGRNMNAKRRGSSIRRWAVAILVVTLFTCTSLASRCFAQDVVKPEVQQVGPAKVTATVEDNSDRPAKDYGSGKRSGWLKSQDMSGSSQESEEAVDRGLKWLAEHQFPVGGWNFDHRLGPCQGRCSNPGVPMTKAVNGATGLALLAFIDHGNTHQAGAYRQNVTAGLHFLVGRMSNDGSLWEAGGTMYSHAIALMAICGDLRVEQEASDHTKLYPWQVSAAAKVNNGARPTATRSNTNPKPTKDDRTLQERKEQFQRDSLDRMLPPAASKGLKFTLNTQDVRHGGWRYDPKRAESDISVTGWHVMALHSAAAVDLPIPGRTFSGVGALLDSLQGEYGNSYGYRRSAAEATPTRSAIGLLCRVYGGWNRQQIERGVTMLVANGPSENDMYYNYYGTLLLHHYGGPQWDEWNHKMREQLIRTQSHDGHETGSWSFAPSHSNAVAGRHFDTCMACLILETYYRSKPVYSTPQQVDPKPLEARLVKPAQ